MLVIKKIISGFRQSLLESNFNKVKEYINDNCLNRDGLESGQANDMKVPLDMGGNSILNVGDLTFTGSAGFATKGYVDSQNDAQTTSIQDYIDFRTNDIEMSGNDLTGVGTVYGVDGDTLTLRGSYLDLVSTQNEIVCNVAPYVGTFSANGSTQLVTKEYVDSTVGIGDTGTTYLLSAFGLTEGGNLNTPMQACLDLIEASDIKNVTIVIDVTTATVTAPSSLRLGNGWPLKIKGLGTDGATNRATTTLTLVDVPGDMFDVGGLGFLGDSASKNTAVTFELLKVVGQGKNAGQAFLGYNETTPPEDGFPKILVRNCEFHNIQTVADAYAVAFLNIELKECYLNSCTSAFNFSGDRPTSPLPESPEVIVRDCHLLSCSYVIKGALANDRAAPYHSIIIKNNKVEALTDRFITSATDMDYLEISSNYISCVGSVPNWLWSDWYTTNTKAVLVKIENNQVVQTGVVSPSTMALTLGNVVMSGNFFDVKYNSSDYLVQVASNSPQSPKIFGNKTSYRATAGAGGILGIFQEMKGYNATNRMSNSLQSSSNSVYQSSSYPGYYIVDYEDVAGEIGSNFFAIKVPEGTRGCYVKVSYILRDTTNQASMAAGLNFYATYATQSSTGGYEEDQWYLSDETFDLDPYRTGNTRNVDVTVDTSKNIYFENTNTPRGDFLVVEMRGTGTRTNPTATGNEDRLPQVKIEAYWI